MICLLYKLLIVNSITRCTVYRLNISLAIFICVLSCKHMPMLCRSAYPILSLYVFFFYWWLLRQRFVRDLSRSHPNVNRLSKWQSRWYLSIIFVSADIVIASHYSWHFFLFVLNKALSMSMSKHSIWTSIVCKQCTVGNCKPLELQCNAFVLVSEILFHAS